MKTVFLGFPFGIPEIRRAVELAIEGQARLKCADMELTHLQLLDKIEDMMLEADLRLFDVTGHNVNVAVEFGIARGLRLNPLILWCEDPSHKPVSSESDIFSDLRGIDSLRYKTFEELTTLLRTRIPYLLSQTTKKAYESSPRLQARLQSKVASDGTMWFTGSIFNAGQAPANRVKVALAGYLLHPTIPTPPPVRIGTIVPGEEAKEFAFRRSDYGMISYATGTEHVLVEFTDEQNERFEQRGVFLASHLNDGTYSFLFQGLGPPKAIEKFSLPLIGLENP